MEAQQRLRADAEVIRAIRLVARRLDHGIQLTQVSPLQEEAERIPPGQTCGAVGTAQD
jgi:hypothetical protein